MSVSALGPGESRCYNLGNASEFLSHVIAGNTLPGSKSCSRLMSVSEAEEVDVSLEKTSASIISASGTT